MNARHKNESEDNAFSVDPESLSNEDLQHAIDRLFSDLDDDEDTHIEPIEDDENDF